MRTELCKWRWVAIALLSLGTTCCGGGGDIAQGSSTLSDTNLKTVTTGITLLAGEINTPELGLSNLRLAATDTLGNFYVEGQKYSGGDAYTVIRKVSAQGEVTTIFPTSTSVPDFPGIVFGVTSLGELIAGCVVTPPSATPTTGFFHRFNAICRMAPGGIATMVPGTLGLHAYSGTVDSRGNVFALDADNLSARQFMSDGSSRTLLSMTSNLPGSGNYCSFGSMAVDPAGNAFVSNNLQIFRVGVDGVVSLLAGWAETPCYTNEFSVRVDGIGSAARFANINSMATDTTGNLFVMDRNTIRKVTPAGVVTTVAGQPDSIGVKLGPLPGSFNSPNGLSYVPGSANQKFATIDENSVLVTTLP